MKYCGVVTQLGKGVSATVALPAAPDVCDLVLAKLVVALAYVAE